MTATIYCNPDDYMTQLAEHLFGYSGRKFMIRPSDQYHCENYWSNGSKKSFWLIKREGLEEMAPPATTTNPMNKVAHTTFDIPPGCFVIEHYISGGKDFGITFIVRPDELDTKMLPAAAHLNEDERIVLAYTAGLKSSYSGISNYRFYNANRDTGITQERWDAAKQTCIERKLLNKQGAITPDGRNAIGNTRPENIAWEYRNQ